MTAADIIPILQATGGALTQDTLRQHTGSYQAIQKYLSSLGLAHVVKRGKRPVWTLTADLESTCAALRQHAADPVEKRRVHRQCAATVARHTARHWMVVHDPEERFTSAARFGVSDLRRQVGQVTEWYEWLVPGMVLEHDRTGARLYVDGDGVHKLDGVE